MVRKTLRIFAFLWNFLVCKFFTWARDRKQPHTRVVSGFWEKLYPQKNKKHQIHQNHLQNELKKLSHELFFDRKEDEHIKRSLIRFWETKFGQAYLNSEASSWIASIVFAFFTTQLDEKVCSSKAYLFYCPKYCEVCFKIAFFARNLR